MWLGTLKKRIINNLLKFSSGASYNFSYQTNNYQVSGFFNVKGKKDMYLPLNLQKLSWSASNKSSSHVTSKLCNLLGLWMKLDAKTVESLEGSLFNSHSSWRCTAASLRV